MQCGTNKLNCHIGQPDRHYTKRHIFHSMQMTPLTTTAFSLSKPLSLSLCPSLSLPTFFHIHKHTHVKYTHTHKNSVSNLICKNTWTKKSRTLLFHSCHKTSKWQSITTYTSVIPKCRTPPPQHPSPKQTSPHPTHPPKNPWCTQFLWLTTIILQDAEVGTEISGARQREEACSHLKLHSHRLTESAFNWVAVKLFFPPPVFLILLQRKKSPASVHTSQLKFDLCVHNLVN